MHVRDIGLGSASDQDVWDFAKANEFVIVSKDVDFQQRSLLRGHPPKVIWIRIGNRPTEAVTALLKLCRSDIDAFDRDPVAAFLVLT